jgi:alpha-1,2-mannosyltransferase
LPQGWQKLWTALARADWLTAQRAIGYAAILLFYELVAGGLLIAQTHGAFGALNGPPATTDFISFYAAGLLADSGAAHLVYHKAVHYAAEVALISPQIPYNFFYYPPIFLTVCAALARLPYVLSYVLFEALGLCGYLYVAKKILPQRQWTALIPLLAFPAVFWTIALGQNSLLTAALFGGATLLIDERPILAGLLIGALSYKPHFGLLIPVALAAGRHWRAFFSAAACVAALTALSIGLFGWETWQAFFASAAQSHLIYESHQIDREGIATPFGAVLMLGGGATLAYMTQGAAALLAAGWVAYVWHRGFSLPVRAATLAAAIPMAVPVLLYYDLLLGAIAMAWLVRAARQHGFAPWQKITLAALYLSPLLMSNMNIAPRFLMAPAASMILFALTISFTLRELHVINPSRVRHQSLTVDATAPHSVVL